MREVKIVTWGRSVKKQLRVGSELDSYCGSCKLLLNHVVVAMVSDAPGKVRCLTCQREHKHRLPSTKSTTSRRSSSGTTRKTKSSAPSAAARWQALMAGWEDDKAKPYSIYSSFELNDWINHSKFGRGGVIEVPGPDRIITLFESGEKTLMAGRTRG